MPFGWKAPAESTSMNHTGSQDGRYARQIHYGRFNADRTDPPSTIRGIFPWSWAHTCSAEVGESRLERLASSAAKGPWKRWMTACIKGWEGHLRATEFKPAVTSSGMIGFLGTTKVKGPARSASLEARQSNTNWPHRLQHPLVGNMHDQWIGRGASLGFKYPSHRLSV